VKSLALALVALALASCIAACGRRATAADCQLIVDKSVEIQLKEMSETDAAAIAEHKAHIRSELDEEIQSCQSRRVTDRTIACVQAATSSQELDRCLR
jgi:uncharacterized OsmC-like protein